MTLNEPEKPANKNGSFLREAGRALFDLAKIDLEIKADRAAAFGRGFKRGFLGFFGGIFLSKMEKAEMEIETRWAGRPSAQEEAHRRATHRAVNGHDPRPSRW